MAEKRIYLSGNTPEARQSQYWAQVVNRKAYQTEKAHQKYDKILPFLLASSVDANDAVAKITAEKSIAQNDKLSIASGLRKASAEVDALLESSPDAFSQ